MKQFNVLGVGLLLALGGCASVPAPTLDEIVAMARQGRPAAAIVEAIDAGQGVYPLNAAELVALSRQGVPDPVLNHLLDTLIELERNRAFWLARDFHPWPGNSPYLNTVPRLPPLLSEEKATPPAGQGGAGAMPEQSAALENASVEASPALVAQDRSGLPPGTASVPTTGQSAPIPTPEPKDAPVIAAEMAVATLAEPAPATIAP